MAKLIVLALAFTALLAFASAHKTIVTTTTIEDDENRPQQCSQQVEDQSFNQCDKYFRAEAMRSPIEKQAEKAQGHGLGQMCCKELENVDEQCQCQAVKKVIRDAMMSQQQRRQGGSFGGQMVERLKQKAEKVMTQCDLQITKEDCQMGTITTTTMITEENPRFPPHYGTGGSQQCSQMMPQRFNQCEKFVEQALEIGSPRIVMSINKHKQQKQIQKLQQQCCDELENVQQECQCDALEKVYEQAMQQQGQQQQGGQMQQVQQVVQVLKNRCDLQTQQCMIPSEMF